MKKTAGLFLILTCFVNVTVPAFADGRTIAGRYFDWWREEYNAPDANRETAPDWEEPLKRIMLSGDWREDLLSIARSQMGYRQSDENYVLVGSFANGHYSRYGDWYGLPYGNWCAMFISFCLYYAGIPETAFPRDSGCWTWVNSLTERGMFIRGWEYEPSPGDVIFFDYNDGLADHVGIVLNVDRENGTLTTVEGNHEPDVRTFTYYDYLHNGMILGYGILPENPDPVAHPAVTDFVSADTGSVLGTASVTERNRSTQEGMAGSTELTLLRFRSPGLPVKSVPARNCLHSPYKAASGR